MRPEHCVTRNHIEVWHTRALPPGPERIRFRTVLRGSLLPLPAWAGAACFASVFYHPLTAPAVVGLFALLFTVGSVRRRQALHSVRCSVYGALGGVLDKSLAGL
ncbi:hypothetical protein OG242_18360 [Streptomyces sp. NBC_00727]|uniref:hypothetical protein n=1 Tax=Streptomyces sp. NBC_00727 TaxID=2903675 RepID=UPI00386491F3